jgi:hypothetical protein
MNQYKTVELFLNAACITGFLLFFVITQSFEWLFVSYFIIGALQLFSIFFHLAMGWFTRYTWRWVYLVLLLTLLVLLTITPLFILWGLLYAAPLFALLYTYICYREWKILQFKELIHLK